MTAVVLTMLGIAMAVLPPRAHAERRLRALRRPARGLPARPGRPAPRDRDDQGPSGLLRTAASWDLLAAALRAGLSVPAAIAVAVEGLPGEAARVLQATADLLALGAEPEQAWGPPADCPRTEALARAGRRAGRSGSALAAAVADLAEGLRARVGDAAEARAERAGVLITLPLGLCFLPAFLCLGVVPVVLGLAGRLAPGI